MILTLKEKTNLLEKIHFSKMFKSLASIIVPVFNGEKYIGETLKSILSQDYAEKEIIVINDGSTDRSEKIIQSFSEIKYIVQENSGVPEARNRGIRESRGEFIAFSDQDDIWRPNKLSDQVNYLLENPQTDYVISMRKTVLEEGVTPPAWLKKELLDSENIDHSPSSLLARKSVFEKVGFFNSELKNASDVDWFFRAKDEGSKKGVIQKVHYLKLIHQDNQSYRVKELHAEYMRLIKQSIKRHKEG